MAILSIQTANNTLTFAAANVSGDSFSNGGTEILLIKNANAANCTVTVDSPVTCNFGTANNAAHDLTIVCAGNASAPVITRIGPFSKVRFDDVNSRVQITYDTVTDVTVAVTRA
jgi:hypothetical protein